MRRNTTTIHVGSVPLGSCAPIVVQSMTKVPTTDVDRCVEQIRALVQAGCELVRVAVPRRADTAAFARIVPQAGVPLIADIHFSPARAIEAIEAGAEDVETSDGSVEINTKPEMLEKVRAALIKKNIPVASAEISMIPKNHVDLDEKSALQTLKLMEKLEDLDDVQHVFTNTDFSDEAIEKYAAAA